MTMFSYFTDVVLRGPTIGSMLMCLTAALVGVLTFLRRQSLLGEALSHAAYPGVIVGVICAGALSLDDYTDTSMVILIMGGATITALLGLWAIHWLEKHLKIRSDSALCFVLSAFFGIGLTLASDVQVTYSALYRQAQAYLYGQAATMTDTHILIYGILSVVVLTIILFFSKEIQAIIFNSDFAQSLGIKVALINAIVFIMTVLAVVIGIRSVGVVLMSAMLIAPAAAARQYTNRFHILLGLAALFGLISGYLGNYLSVELSQYLTEHSQERLTLPTGPMIVLVASAICLISLLIAPERGLLLRLVRIALFQYRCRRENLLKFIWKCGPDQDTSINQMTKFQYISPLYLHGILWDLKNKNWLYKTGRATYRLTSIGQQKAAKIVRLHRLWEVYLVEYLGVGAERVHRNAEEMEHIITPELEQELTLLLKDPKIDPHHQLIPPKDSLV